MALSEKEWFIEAPWGKLCVVAWGNCLDPPVLVCHGALDSAASFRPLIKLLPENFYYIGMEFPGFGKSDPMPPGLMISTHDLMYALHVVVKHFRWNNFILLGHSMGCHLGRLYVATYPEKVVRMIQLDPIANRTAVPVEKFGQWYKQMFTDYFDNYQTYNSPREMSPKYKKSEAIEKLMKSRGLNKEAAEATLERWSEPTGDGHIRFTYDQRNKIITYVPYSEKQVKSVYTKMATPTLTLIAEDSTRNGSYKGSEYLLDESSFPGNNYRVRTVQGNHDVHIVHPERVAAYVSQFLLYGTKGLDTKSSL